MFRGRFMLTCSSYEYEFVWRLLGGSRSHLALPLLFGALHQLRCDIHSCFCNKCPFSSYHVPQTDQDIKLESGLGAQVMSRRERLSIC